MATDPFKLTSVAAVVHPKCSDMGKKYQPSPTASALHATAFTCDKEYAVPASIPTLTYFCHPSL
jgi:hypothetical protein